MDAGAVTILLDMFWSPRGWRPERERRIAPQDFEYAKAAGVMFDPVAFTHDDTVARLRAVIEALDPADVGDAFAASFTTRRLDWRSALGSFAVFRHLQEHAATGERRCPTCGMWRGDGPEDLNVLNFERLKWGGVRHTAPVYALFDLETFSRQSRPRPTAADVALLSHLISALEQVPAGTTAAQLHAQLPKALGKNKAERDIIVGMLGFIGALATDAHPGFDGQFVPDARRELPPRRHVDMAYPACWWRADDGFRRAALAPYFGHRVEI